LKPFKLSIAQYHTTHHYNLKGYSTKAGRTYRC